MLRSRLPEVALCLAVSLLVMIIIVKLGIIIIVNLGMIIIVNLGMIIIVTAGEDHHCQVGGDRQVGCRQFQH